MGYPSEIEIETHIQKLSPRIQIPSIRVIRGRIRRIRHRLTINSRGMICSGPVLGL
jgi:hypothetical protein